jgi:monoamine oxidase
MTRRSDVLIVGAGFAGAVAARELRRSGRNVVLLEARDRVGGRAWTREAWGRSFDVGGQRVHWAQPHIWAELTRYGKTIYDSQDVTVALFRSGSGLEEMSPDEMTRRIDWGFARISPIANAVFERPYDPFHHADRVAEIDSLSMAEGLASLEFAEGERDIVDAALTVGFSAPLEFGAFTQGLRRFSLASGHSIIGDIVRYRVDGGLQGVVESVLEDADADVQLSAQVDRIEQNADGVHITTRDGLRWTAESVIVTVPTNTLTKIDFSPGLSGSKLGLTAERQATQGCMFWVMLRGQYEPFVALASSDYPLCYMRYDGDVEDGVVAQVLGPDASQLSLTNLDQVQAAVRQWLPEAVVGGTVGNDWVTDEFTLQTWAIARPSQMTMYHRDLMRREGNVYFAGADYASGWYGYVDGAIESGLTVAHRIRADVD